MDGIAGDGAAGVRGGAADGLPGHAVGEVPGHAADGVPGGAVDGVPDNVVVRPVLDGELEAVAALRWQWVLENGGTPVATRGEFLRHFVDWARENAGSHRCLVMLRGAEIIGMAWLAVVRRVPSPRALERASGDVQCVYVVPAERDGGLGGRLIDAVRELAREAGLERVTVHSSSRAVPVYSRHGFAASPRLLQAPGGGEARSGSGGPADPDPVRSGGSAGSSSPCSPGSFGTSRAPASGAAGSGAGSGSDPGSGSGSGSSGS
ncbi:GNAT family N-acetyltransferase [Streptomyces albus]|uniref:GNAT family N-acetyltransferase n=1 Tax=Streptomyces albus TaxID=1888 RepID=UPI00099B4DAD|nr:GNAT family N-acetyltransferase [Streptomyces albus]